MAGDQNSNYAKFRIKGMVFEVFIVKHSWADSEPYLHGTSTVEPIYPTS